MTQRFFNLSKQFDAALTFTELVDIKAAYDAEVSSLNWLPLFASATARSVNYAILGCRLSLGEAHRRLSKV